MLRSLPLLRLSRFKLALAPCAIAPCALMVAASLAFAQGPSFFTNVQVLNLGATGAEIDYSPTLNAAETYMIFASTRAGGSGGYDLYETSRPDTNSAWGAPINLAALNTSGADYEPTLSADGLELLFVSTLRAPKLGTADAWVTTRTSLTTPWSTPVNIGAPVNGAGWAVDDVHLTDDGLTMFYTSSELGGYKIFTVTRLASVLPWTNKLQFLPASSTALDHSPTPEANGNIVWFSSSRLGGTGSSDFYVTYRDSSSLLWSTPVEVKEMNTVNWESNAWRRGTTGTIYWSYSVPARIYTATSQMVEQLEANSPVSYLLPLTRPTWPTQVAWLRRWSWKINTTHTVEVYDGLTTQALFGTFLSAKRTANPIQIPAWIGTVELDPATLTVLSSGLRTPGITSKVVIPVPNNSLFIGQSLYMQSVVVELVTNQLTVSHPAEVLFN